MSKTPHKWAKEIHAFAEGEIIESRRKTDHHWYIDPSPYFAHNHLEFRIKPKMAIRYRVALMREKEIHWLNVVTTDIAHSQIEKSPWFIRWTEEWKEVAE